MSEIRNCTSTTNIRPVNCAGYSEMLSQQPTKMKSATASRRTPTNPTAKTQGGIPKPKAVGQPISKVAPTTIKAQKNTTRPQPNKEPHGKSSWDKILKERQSSETTSPFNNFDPLRTLHFLVAELHSRIGYSNSGDGKLQQMVVDMQNALERIPPDVASKMHLNNECDMLPPFRTIEKEVRRFVENIKPEKLKKEKSIRDQSCQVTQMESELSQLGNIYKQMQILYSKVQKEKTELKHLRLEKKQTTRMFGEDKVSERDRLQSQVNVLKNEVLQNKSSRKEMQLLIQKLQEEKNRSQREIRELKDELAKARGEKKNSLALLEKRNKQLSEFQSEVFQLRQIINKELLELQHTPNPSILPSPTGLTAQFQSEPLKTIFGSKNDENDDMTISSISLNSELNNERPHDSNFMDVQSQEFSTALIDPKVVSSDDTEIAENFDLEGVNLQTNFSSLDSRQRDIRNKFSQLKRQAFLFTTDNFSDSKQ